METPKASVKKIALNYGLLMGLASIVFGVVLYAPNMHIDRPWWTIIISLGISILFLVYGFKAFKKDNGGFMSLGEALKVGVAISAIAGIISVIFNYIFVTFIEKDYVEKVLELTRERMIEQNPELTEEQMEMSLSIVETMSSPGLGAAFGIAMALFFGFLLSLIIGAIMKQSRPAGY